MSSHFYVAKAQCEVIILIDFWNRFRFSQAGAEIELKSPEFEGVLPVELVDPYKAGKGGRQKSLWYSQG